jgi:hypothetical protein
MFGGARALSDQQNALVRQFQPFGHPIGQQFSPVEAAFFAAKLAQKDGGSTSLLPLRRANGTS